MKVSIIDGNTTETVCGILKISQPSMILNSQVVDWNTPPFVKIGKLYVSLTIVGADSWVYIAKKYSTERFTVLAGRHGNVINPIDSSGWLRNKEEAQTKNDPAHPDQDRKNASHINGKNGERIKVVDVREDEFRTASGLRSKIMTGLVSGGVILSWCYGFYTMQTSYDVKHGEDVSDPTNSNYATWKKLLDSRICDIVKSDWSWVPR
jgi:hypothetical protein